MMRADKRARTTVTPGEGASVLWKERVHIQVIAWEDICVVIDDGGGKPSDYEMLRDLLARMGREYPAGLGCLTVIPPDAKPPSDEARKALNEGLEVVRLRCICWLVEGTGFQGAMVRAVLTGLRFFVRAQYPRNIVTSLEEAIAWMLPHLEGGAKRVHRVEQAAEAICAQRAQGRFVRTL
jgi:hypothetical protein